MPPTYLWSHLFNKNQHWKQLNPHLSPFSPCRWRCVLFPVHWEDKLTLSAVYRTDTELLWSCVRLHCADISLCNIRLVMMDHVVVNMISLNTLYSQTCWQNLLWCLWGYVIQQRERTNSVKATNTVMNGPCLIWMLFVFVFLFSINLISHHRSVLYAVVYIYCFRNRWQPTLMWAQSARCEV